MDGEQNAKWNKSDREREIVYDIIYMWSLKKIQKKTVNIKKDKQTHKCREQMKGYQWGRGKEQYRG